jgi:hypothetical protein
MCDFRDIKKIKLLEFNEVVEVNNFSLAPHNDRSKAAAPGLYHFAATGSWCEYFDGSRWLKENQDYKVVDFTIKNLKCDYHEHKAEFRQKL